MLEVEECELHLIKQYICYDSQKKAFEKSKFAVFDTFPHSSIC